MKDILPRQLWTGLGSYCWWGRNAPMLLADDEQGLPIRGNVSACGAERGFASLYHVPMDKRYLDAGEAVIDYRAFSQPCWNPR